MSTLFDSCRRRTIVRVALSYNTRNRNDPNPSRIGRGTRPTNATLATTLRWISSTPFLRDGALAEHCNRNVVSSPWPDFSQELWDKPLPDFLLSAWKEQQQAKTGTVTNSENENENLAIYDGSTGMKRTFGDYYHDTAGIAGSLKHDLGVGETSCVCLFAPNHVDYLPVTLAVGLCGAKLTPVNPLYTADELTIVLDKSKTSVLIAHKANLDVALQAAKNANINPCVLVMTEDGEKAHHGLESLESIKRHSRAFDTTGDAYHCEPTTYPYLLPYSSGTTGMPKGVCLTHANLVVNLLQTDVCEGPPLNPGDGLVSPLPFFHIYGMVISMMYYSWKGCPVYTMSGQFDLERMLDMIQTHKPVNAHLVPPIMVALAKSPLVDNYNLSSLKSIISAASPLGIDTETAVRNRLDCQVKQGWGMSELSPLGTLAPSSQSEHSSNDKAGSVGLLMPNTFGKVLDGNGTSLGPNQDGELIIKGPQVMLGYLDEPEKTSECLSSSGWLRTGDLAYYDDDGWFYITDRIKELIKVRGFQVAPAELEELLLGHEYVNDAAVIQIPDDDSGELPLAYIVLKDGVCESGGTGNDDDDKANEIKQLISEWVKERVAPHKRLAGGINFVDSIPKSASGKILRRILRKELAEQMQA